MGYVMQGLRSHDLSHVRGLKPASAACARAVAACEVRIEACTSQASLNGAARTAKGVGGVAFLARAQNEAGRGKSGLDSCSAVPSARTSPNRSGPIFVLAAGNWLPLLSELSKLLTPKDPMDFP